MNNQLQTLLHDNLMICGHVEECAIFRRRDVLLRAFSTNLSLSVKEMEQVTALFQSASQIRTEGFTLRDVPYQVIRADKYSIYGKHKDEIKQGIVIVRTATLIIISTYSSDMHPSICVEVTEKLGDYFREKGK